MQMPCDSITPVELEGERPNAMGRILLATGRVGDGAHRRDR
jgi:hypothetical protein